MTTTGPATTKPDPTTAPVTEISVATACDRHFDFTATGATPDAARKALRAAWRYHAAQVGADPHHFDDDDVIKVVTGPLGQAFRDYSPIPPKQDA